MENIRKQFQEIFAVLDENQNKKVSTIMPQLLELMSRRNNNSGHANTFLKDENGNVVAIFCYYHKLWELVDTVDYGKKANTATGLNTMCKEGVSNWTKQQRKKKQAEAELLNQVADGLIKVEEIGYYQQQIQQDATAILPRLDGQGVETVEEVWQIHNS